MRTGGWFVVLVLGLTPWAAASAHLLPRPNELDRVNRRLSGRVVDHTHNHGADRRIWSPALGERRDMYVYLPPSFDPAKRYPVIIWLHGFAQDEQSFLNDAVQPLDDAIRCGKLPPVIVAAPDGSLKGIPGVRSAGSFFLNTEAGNFEDYLVQDVWNFLVAHYPIRPEPEAHVMAGVSMGGGAAFHTVLKYPDRFKTAVAFFPPLNLRWEDCHGRYRAEFDPNCWGWRSDFSRGRDVLGRFYGIYTIRQRQLAFPLFIRGAPDTPARISRDNPIEMLDAYDVQDGQVNLYVGYGGLDQFFMEAQVESFLFRARERGVTVGVEYLPRGKHDLATALKLLPGAIDWLRPRLAAYGPIGEGDGATAP